MERTVWPVCISVVLCCVGVEAADPTVCDQVLAISPFAPATDWNVFGDLNELQCTLEASAATTPNSGRRSELLAACAFLSWCRTDKASAAEYVRRSLEAAQTDPYALIISANVLRTEESISRLASIPAESEWYEDAVLTRAKSMHAKAYEDVVQAQGKMVDRQQAERALELLRSLKHPKPYSHLVNAFVLQTLGKKEEALAQVDQYLQLYTVGRLGEPEAPYFVQAELLSDLGKHQAALNACERGLRLKPQSKGLRVLMVETLCELGQGDKALQVAVEMAKEEPASTVSDYAMSKALMRLHHFRKSIVYLERLRIKEHMEQAVVDLVHASMYCGQFDKVSQYVDEFNGKVPKNRARAAFVFDAAVSECYTAECSDVRRRIVKEALKVGVEERLCCMQHVVLAVGAIHNMGDTVLARELADGIKDSECDKPALRQLERLRKAMSEETEMLPIVWDRQSNESE